MENLDQLALLMHPVVDQDRSMNQLTDSRQPFHGTSDVRESLQQFYVIEKGVSESLGGTWKVYPGVI